MGTQRLSGNLRFRLGLHYVLCMHVRIIGSMFWGTAYDHGSGIFLTFFACFGDSFPPSGLLCPVWEVCSSLRRDGMGNGFWRVDTQEKRGEDNLK